MGNATVEERLADLEARVAAMERGGSSRPGVTGRTNPEVLEELFGIFRDDPYAQQVLDEVEREREQERQQARRAA
jgi:hypothetical protein